MQQRQLRLGDILDDYCPRERRVTNHAVVAMIGDDVKRTRCTTCDAEHEFKHARVPRQRRKPDFIGTHPGVAVVKRAVPPPPAHDEAAPDDALEYAPDDAREIGEPEPFSAVTASAVAANAVAVASAVVAGDLSQVPVQADLAAEAFAVAEDAHGDDRDPSVDGEPSVEEGPVHRRLIRAQLPRIEGQPPAPSQRQTPDFTIRQPGGRPNRFSNRQQRNAFYANRSQNGNGMSRDSRGGQRMPNGRPGGPHRDGHGHGHGNGRKRSK